MSAINRPPLGLQGLLGSQNFGDNPSDLLQQVRPTIDLFPFLGSQVLSQRQIQGGRVDQGLIVTQPVESGEVWAIVGASGFCDPSGPGPYTLSMAIGLNDLNNVSAVGGTHYMAQTRQATGQAGNHFQSVSWNPPQPLILESDTAIELWWMSANLAAPDTCTLSVLYYALPA